MVSDLFALCPVHPFQANPMPPLTMKHVIALLLPLLLCAPVWAQRPSHNFEVAKSLDIFNAIYRDLDLYYVDTLDAKRNIENATDYMLNQLDPYTEYFPENATSELRQLTTGKYAGIGSAILYRKDSDRCIIAEPYEHMPAADAGLQPGDVILSIDGENLPVCGSTPVAQYTSDVSSRLRGDAGTKFDIRVRRPATGQTFTFTLTRRNISMPSVTLRKLLPDSVGYVHVTQFIEGTASDLRRAITDLKQQGARRLVLDLRGNPGGVIDEAVRTVNLFIPRGREVVSTRGKVKEANNTYKTTSDPLDTEIPLVVLVDNYSASASEITSGALQDYDRAVILGRRTYGKGLVQQSREMPYKGVLKLTSAKYYIPSGRCVQAYEFKDGLPVARPDSLCHTFHTAAGRPVRDGGGVMPDVVVPTDSLPHLLGYLEMSDQLFDFCSEYHARHASIASPSEFRLSNEEYAAFCAYMKKHQFTYDRQSLRVLQTLRQVIRFEGYDAEASEEFKALEAKLRHNEDRDFSRWEKEVRKVVERKIVERYYYAVGGEDYQLRDDSDLQRAINLLNTPHEMRKILTGEPDA